METDSPPSQKEVVQKDNPLKTILTRLSDNLIPERKSLKERTRKIQKIIERNAFDIASGYQNLFFAYTRFENKHQEKENFEDNLIALLLYQNRHQIDKDKFDPKKEERQIGNIISLLSNRNHLQADTGEGKDTVILPISAITISLTSPERSVFLGSCKPEKISQFKEGLSFYIEKLPKQMRKSIEVIKISPNKEKEELPIGEKLKEEIKKIKRKMFEEAISRGEYSPKTRERIRNLYWQKYFISLQREKKKRGDFLDNYDKKNTPHQIFIGDDRDLIFSFLEDRENFVKRIPRILLDEAHTPYDRDSSYILNSKTEFLTAEETETGLDNWFLAYLIKRKINKESFIVDELGKNLTFGTISALQRGSFIPETLAEKYEIIRKGVAIIGESLGLNQKVTTSLEIRMRRKLKKWEKILQKKEAKEETNKQNNLIFLINEIARHIVMARSGEGEIYIYNEKTGLTVRDNYLGVILKGHRFEALFQTVINAEKNNFVLPNYFEMDGGKISYAAFLYYLREKISLSSGTLLVDEGKRRVKSSFAKLIEDITGKKIYTSRISEKKIPPRPLYFEKPNETLEKIITDIGKNRSPILIVCQSEHDALSLYKKMSEKKKKGVLITASMEEEIEQKQYKRLAMGEIDFIVSSGRSGIGVDIKKENGSFPDLHVIIFGLPKSRLQLRQFLGRRRLKGNKYSWYLTREQIEKFLGAHVNRTIGLFESFQHHIEKTETYLKEKNEKTIPLPWIINLIKTIEAQRAKNDENIITMDLFFSQLEPFLRKRVFENIIPFIKGLPVELSTSIINYAMMSLTPAEKNVFWQNRAIWFQKGKKRNIEKIPFLSRMIKFIEQNLPLWKKQVQEINKLISYGEMTTFPKIVYFAKPDKKITESLNIPEDLPFGYNYLPDPEPNLFSPAGKPRIVIYKGYQNGEIWFIAEKTREGPLKILKIAPSTEIDIPQLVLDNGKNPFKNGIIAYFLKKKQR